MPAICWWIEIRSRGVELPWHKLALDCGALRALDRSVNPSLNEMVLRIMLAVAVGLETYIASY